MDLEVKLHWGSMSFEKVVSDPPDGMVRGSQLTCFVHGRAVLQHAPREKSGSEGHGQAELDTVSGIVHAAAQVDAVVFSICEVGVTTPRNRKTRR